MNEFRESSTLNRMQEHYWTTKQAVFKRLGKKDDDCIIASDAELDAKLELFQTIEESFLTLMRVLENYQDRLCGLAQEENAVGRFLKENGKYDKTRAGRVMSSAGKALSFSAQQKLSLRLPLVRLYHEVETFQYRAIVDSLQTVAKMEKARTSYRGALMWMKDVSQQLDPDTCKQLEKFRKVQSNVRKSKARFDKVKLDTLQKIDLLSFSRCNLFSQALAVYQNALITVCEKVSHTMTSVAETAKGYQHYEFSMLKELTETSKKLAEETSEKREFSSCTEQNLDSAIDKDVLLFFESEYHDEGDIKEKESDKICDSGRSLSISSGVISQKTNYERKESEEEKDKESNIPLLDLGNENLINSVSDAFHSESENVEQTNKNAPTDVRDLLNEIQDENTDKSDLELLKDLLNLSTDLTFSSNATSFHSESEPSESMVAKQQTDADKLDMSLKNSTKSCFLPSQLLDMNASCNASQSNVTGNLTGATPNSTDGSTGSFDNRTLEKDKKGKQDMSSWFNLFADLDPLANPDLIGKKQVDEINC